MPFDAEVVVLASPDGDQFFLYINGEIVFEGEQITPTDLMSRLIGMTVIDYEYHEVIANEDGDYEFPSVYPRRTRP